MKAIQSRALLGILIVLALPVFAQPKTSLRGKLASSGGKAVLETAQGPIPLEGDEDTSKVLKDKRLDGMEAEAVGHFAQPGRFLLDPSYTKNLWILKDGKKLMVTYWCPVCSIRTYTPGECMCCHQETQLDLREPDKP
jgi:hypothetical protein